MRAVSGIKFTRLLKSNQLGFRSRAIENFHQFLLGVADRVTEAGDPVSTNNCVSDERYVPVARLTVELKSLAVIVSQEQGPNGRSLTTTKTMRYVYYQLPWQFKLQLEQSGGEAQH